jgi:hypothetical protein
MADPARSPDSSRDNADVEPDRRTLTGTPRWVKVFGIILAVLVLLFIVVLLFGDGPLGGHGPGRHTGASNAGGQDPLVSRRTLDEPGPSAAMNRRSDLF